MISFDLDMTLLDHRTDQITPSALEAIEKLRPKYKIVLATGRDMDNSLQYIVPGHRPSGCDCTYERDEDHSGR